MRVLNVVNTVFELYYLSSVGYLLKLAHPEISLGLLTKPEIASKIKKELACLYSDVQTFWVPTIAGQLHRDVARGLKFWWQLSRLNLQADVVCVGSFREHFANVLCRYLSNGPRLIALRMADQENEKTVRVKRHRLAAYLNLLNVLFGASTVEYRWHRDAPHAFESQTYKRNPFHRTISISDWGHFQSGNEYRLPPPFLALRRLYGLENGAFSGRDKQILIAGERTPPFQSWDATAQSLYDSFFDFLRQNFPEHRLLFKPRATLTDTEQVPLNGFEVLPSDMPFEELCLRNSYHRVIAMKSTALKVAAYCGQPAFALYPMFDFPQTIRHSLNTYLADTRGVIKIRNFEELLEDPPTMPSPDMDRLSYLYEHVVVGNREPLEEI